MSLPDFDAAYRGVSVVAGLPVVPWNIGVPQPPVSRLIEAGHVRSPVLDVGCGVGATAIALARQGYDAVGVDMSEAAIARAREDATTAGVGAEFHVADASALAGHDGRFATIIDSALFHTLPVEARPDYVAAMARAAQEGALLVVLAFDASAQFADGVRPNCVSAAELAGAVASHWTVDSVSRSSIHALVPTGWGGELPIDTAGRVMFPAQLLMAYRR
jgi:ubiquinone/menaquinone biosynthesis C-methylase UbiE